MGDYSELIKRFDKIRDYMRDFYVFGFMSRDDFKKKKSLRTYDYEKRRIESYLSDYMFFRADENGKSVFLSVDSGAITENPLYRAFKAKTFTRNDITLNFIILDILRDKTAASAAEIADIISSEYLCCFECPVFFDVSTVRNKLIEYEALGILITHKLGKKLLYALNHTLLELKDISDALTFFSEVSPLGVVGSYLQDKYNYDNTLLLYKHHYIMHALESEIVYELLQAIHNRRIVEIVNHSRSSLETISVEIIPLRFMISVQGGRRYLAAFRNESKVILTLRLDYIKSVKIMEVSSDYNLYEKRFHEMLPNAWGISFGNGKRLEHLSMLLHIEDNEHFIRHRIMREGRNGTLSKVDPTTYRYDISVYDTIEMLPWLRTFIGRILSLDCSNQSVVRTFYRDLEELYSNYGGGPDAV